MAFFCSISRGQTPEVNKIPFQFNQFFQSYSILNPASAGHQGKIEVFAGYSGYTGIRKTIYDFFTSANFRLNQKESNKHVLGFNLRGDIDGKYLSSNTFQLNYSYHLALNENYTLSSGIALGIYNSTIKVNEFTGGGSDIAPDGNLGVWIYNHTFGAGIAYGQFFNSKVTPIIETTNLTPFWNVSGYKIIPVNEEWKVKGDLLISFAKAFESTYNISLSANYINKITAGTNFKVGESVILYAGLDSYTINNQSVSLLFSYNISLESNNINNSNKYEITVSYFLDKNMGYNKW